MGKKGCLRVHAIERYTRRTWLLAGLALVVYLVLLGTTWLTNFEWFAKLLITGILGLGYCFAPVQKLRYHPLFWVATAFLVFNSIGMLAFGALIEPRGSRYASNAHQSNRQVTHALEQYCIGHNQFPVEFSELREQGFLAPAEETDWPLDYELRLVGFTSRDYPGNVAYIPELTRDESGGYTCHGYSLVLFGPDRRQAMGNGFMLFPGEAWEHVLLVGTVEEFGSVEVTEVGDR